MPKLTQLLTDEVGRTVVDQTGFTEKFDIHLDFTPTSALTAPADPAMPAGSSIFTALQDQLGLRLESAKGPVDVLVIDHLERPSGN